MPCTGVSIDNHKLKKKAIASLPIIKILLPDYGRRRLLRYVPVYQTTRHHIPEDHYLEMNICLVLS
jgi:hypothetical protein